jgi:hypothetical protein
MIHDPKTSLFNEYKYRQKRSQVIVSQKMRASHSVRSTAKKKKVPQIHFLLQGKILEIQNLRLNMFRWVRR